MYSEADDGKIPVNAFELVSCVHISVRTPYRNPRNAHVTALAHACLAVTLSRGAAAWRNSVQQLHFLRTVHKHPAFSSDVTLTVASSHGSGGAASTCICAPRARCTLVKTMLLPCPGPNPCPQT